MICNDLVMPVLIRLQFFQISKRADLSSILLSIRRGSIVLVLLLSYMDFRFIGEFYALVSIGLVSFAAVAQFAPSILGGIFWKRGTRAGALCGLLAGFLVWAYTLVFPSLVQARPMIVVMGTWANCRGEPAATNSESTSRTLIRQAVRMLGPAHETYARRRPSGENFGVRSTPGVGGRVMARGSPPCTGIR